MMKGYLRELGLDGSDLKGKRTDLDVMEIVFGEMLSKDILYDH